VGCGVGVNRSLHLADGKTSEHGLRTVNGAIGIGSGCTVKGGCTTVNGAITVAADSKVGDLTTVNGSIGISTNVEVDGQVETVNGGIRCDTGSVVDGDMATVNGRIKLQGTRVQGSLSTYNGSVILLDKSEVEHDIIIKRASGNTDDPLTITVSQGSVVHGDVIVRDASRKVTVHLDTGGEIKGEIRNADVVEGDA
jgi:DUF4097 and DUF4098 domain-containing protein YvlB